MVFTTALCFDPGESALLSVSADASARVTLCRKGRSSVLGLPLGCLLLLVLALLALGVAAALWLGLHARAAALADGPGPTPGSRVEL